MTIRAADTAAAGASFAARYEWLLAGAIIAAASIWSQQTQVFRVARYWDADEYVRMSEQFAAGTPITEAAPYAYRVLAPWIVATLSPGDLLHGYLVLNIVAGALIGLLLLVWLRSFVASAAVRLLMVAAYAWQWHGPVRFVYYYPAYVDPTFMVLMMAGLICGERLARRPGAWPAAGLAGAAFVGTLGREAMLLVPACGIVRRASMERRAEGPAWWPYAAAMGAGLAAAACARTFSAPRGDYSFLGAISLHLTNKPVFSVVLAWFIAFGPMIVVVAYDWRDAARFLRARPDILALLAGYAGFAYVGGHDTERYLFWAMPAVYVLVGRAIERQWAVLAGGAIATTLTAAQAIAERVLWDVPDPGSAVSAMSEMPDLASRVYAVLDRMFVIDDFHWNLWSNFGSRPFHVTLLAYYLLLSGVLLVWMHRRSARLGAVAA